MCCFTPEQLANPAFAAFQANEHLLIDQRSKASRIDARLPVKGRWPVEELRPRSGESGCIACTAASLVIVTEIAHTTQPPVQGDEN